MKTLIVGGGGREHALAWKVAQSTRVARLFVAPGNAGTAREPKTSNVPIDPEDLPSLVEFARAQGIDLTLVGPEAPLVAGIVDAFREEGLRCFGPTRAAARLEGSKAFTKQFLERHGIATAPYGVFTKPREAYAFIHRVGAPIVVKADGLAAGKGVVVAQTEAEALATVERMLVQDALGVAGRRIVVEQLLRGEEVSFIVMADGKNVLAMATSQDHKARDDGDRGPNTGGMGAYSPAPVVTTQIHERILSEIVRPTVRGMAADGSPYTGFLYAGLMIGEDGRPRVLEFNCRFGDPEAQPIMLRLRSDLVELCAAALEGHLDQTQTQWDPRACLGVVLAAEGYPGACRKGEKITGLEQPETADLKVFHAATTSRNGALVTAGGRVLCVCALGETVTLAQKRAYDKVQQIHANGLYWRSDIGYRAVARETHSYTSSHPS
jgi:phosphoribosylamine--glycine ligase